MLHLSIILTLLSCCRFPKMGLNGQYIGDTYPLCSDLPPQHFLSQGSTYQLLDSPAPELHMDPIEWRSGTESTLVLDPSSNLYTALAAEAPKLKIVLGGNLACTGDECSVDAVRVVKAGDYYYEYIRSPCVHQAFYNDAKTIAKRTKGEQAMCADPRDASATAACCGDSDAWSEQVSVVLSQSLVLICLYLSHQCPFLQVLGRKDAFCYCL